MNWTRLQIVLQLILQVLYPDNYPRPPLVLIGCGNAAQEFTIAEKVFKLGVPISVLREDRGQGNEHLLDTLEREFKSKILIDFDELRDKTILRKIADRELFSSTREFFFIGSDFADFQQSIHSVPVFIHSQIKFAEINGSNVKIHSIKNTAQPYGGRFQYHLEKELSTNSDDNQLVHVRETPWANDDFDWSSVSLPIGIVSLECANSSVVSNEFIEWYQSESEASRDATPRLGFTVFRAIQGFIGFNYSIVCAESWAVSSDSGGALGQMVNNEIILCTAPMLALLPRLRLLDFLYPLTHFRSTFTFQTPTQNDLTGSAFLKPFSWTLWICVLCSVVLVGVAMQKTVQMEIQTSGDGYDFVPSLPLMILNTLGGLCQQGMTLVLKWNTSRIMQSVFLLAGIVVYNYYTSLVVSELISFPKPTNLNSLKALEESNLELGAQNISYLHYYMKDSDLDYVRNLYKRMSSKAIFLYNPAEGVKKAKRPGFAYHCETKVTLGEMVKTYDLFEMCNYHEISLIKSPIYVTAKKNSPLGEFFKIQFMRTMELGIRSKMDKIYGEPKIACLSNALIEQVRVKNVAPVLLLLVYGMILSLIILIVEIACNWGGKKKKKKEENRGK